MVCLHCLIPIPMPEPILRPMHIPIKFEMGTVPNFGTNICKHTITEDPRKISIRLNRPYPSRLCERLGILSSADNGGCGGAFTADSGVMISPNYPNPYPHNAQCVYTVTVHQNEIMNLTFTSLELEQPIGGSCEWDYVEAREKKLHSGGSKRGALEARPLTVQFLSFSCSFWQKISQIIDWRTPLGVGAISRKVWICHCRVCLPYFTAKL